MPEFLTLLPPDDARELLLAHLAGGIVDSESITTIHAQGRINAEDVLSPHALPEFPRSTVDGFAVRAADTFGAGDSLPAYLTLVGEVPMGAAPIFEIGPGGSALIHTGGMLPKGADSVVMLEFTQRIEGAGAPGVGGDRSTSAQLEIFKAVADGENVIRTGEDVAQGQLILTKGRLIRPTEIGGLAALGILTLRVARKPWVGIISTGDEVIEPSGSPKPGQVRDVNSYTLGALVEKEGGIAIRYGIIGDQLGALKALAAKALAECDMVIVTAGSSASTRDMTAEVIGSLGEPGVLVHGINTRPGKPTILGVCAGKAVIGLPGNPVSALVNGYLFVVPVISRLLGALPTPKPTVRARLTINLASQAGREDWWPVKLVAAPVEARDGQAYGAEPLFGKSNLIFSLSAADGLMRIPADATGLGAGEFVEVVLI